jgi:capsular polysaccharide biosynthesis protein
MCSNLYTTQDTILHTRVTTDLFFKAVREAEILVGNHGAGLTNLIFLDKDTHVVEFTCISLNFANGKSVSSTTYYLASNSG